MNKPFIGVQGKDSLLALFESGFLVANGIHGVDNDTVDIGLLSEGWISNEPFASTGDLNRVRHGKAVSLEKLVLRPGETLTAMAKVSLNLLPPYYAFFSPRSRMARVGVKPTVHVEGFSQMNWAYSNSGVSRKMLVSVTSRIPVTGLDKVPLFQMRVFSADTRVDYKSMMGIMSEGHDLLINPKNGKPIAREKQLKDIDRDGKLVSRLHLQKGVTGFKLKKKTPVLDLSRTGQPWDDYFEPVFAKSDDTGKLFVDLSGAEYYLFITELGLNIPRGYVASLEQLDARLVEAVIHFAEYFGHMFKGAATLEVVPIASAIRVYQGTPVGAFRLERIDPSAPTYSGFSVNQHHLPQLPPMVTMPKFDDSLVIAAKK